MLRLAIKPLLSLALSFSLAVVNADSDDNHSWLNMSFEELLEVRIVSKKPERVMDAPAVVSVYQASQLKAMGMRNIRDFISFIPGFIVNESLLGNNPIQVRGIADANNQKVLFLVNSVPYWMASHGDIGLNGIPFEAIERIEVIRGPGSVIYGTNASAGVINIITRKDDDDAVFLSAGSNNLVNGNVYMGWQKKGTGHITFAVEVNDETFDADVSRAISGFDPASGSFFEDLSATYQHKTQYASMLVSGAYHGFSFMLQSYRSERTGGANGSIVSTRDMRYQGSLLHVAYAFSALRGQWLVYADYNPFYQNSEIEDLFALRGVAGDGRVGSNKNDGNYRTRVGGNYRFEANYWELLAGLEYERRSVGEFVFADEDGGATLMQLGVPVNEDGALPLILEDDNSEQSFFLQYTGFYKNWRLDLGGRFTDNELYGKKTTPRVSLSYRLNPVSSLKLLYSEGFNSPAFIQTSAIDLFGQPFENQLSPELTFTWDAVYTYQDHVQQFVFNIYDIEIKDIITRSPETSGFVNGQGFVRQGFEVDYIRDMQALRWTVNLAYIKQGNTIAEDDPSAYFAPKWQLGLGGQYRLDDHHQLGLSLMALSDRADADSYYLLNIHYQYTLNTFTLTTTLRNALNAEVVHPDVRAFNEVLIQAEDGRHIIAKMAYQF